jgi:hypothetical protein
VWPVAQLSKLPASLGFEDRLERHLERFPGLPRSVPRPAHQDLDFHVGNSLVLLHSAPSFHTQPLSAVTSS